MRAGLGGEAYCVELRRSGRCSLIGKRAERATDVSQRTRNNAHPITPKPGVLGAPVRAARPDPSLRKSGLLGMTTGLTHYSVYARLDELVVGGRSQGEPIGSHALPFLDQHAVGLEESADAWPFPAHYVFENRCQD